MNRKPQSSELYVLWNDFHIIFLILKNTFNIFFAGFLYTRSNRASTAGTRVIGSWVVSGVGNCHGDGGMTGFIRKAKL